MRACSCEGWPALGESVNGRRCAARPCVDRTAKMVTWPDHRNRFLFVQACTKKKSVLAFSPCCRELTLFR